jgi:peptidoglycan/xylan/chitin deacetylase (PgdA/CDA1 family)
MNPRGDSILMYHGTPWRDAAHLERQLRALSVLFHIVPLEDLARARPNGRRRIALTFDDGLKSNVEVAYPILRELGLPATFYVCPGLVESGSWMWNHEARQRLLSLQPQALAELAASVGGPGEVEPLVDWMKGLKLPARRQVEDQIRAATPDFQPTKQQRDEFEIAGWSDLKQLDPRVVTIGSHTLSHPILTSLAPDEVDRELRESRSLLEHQLQREVKSFCYPNGNLDDNTVQAARRYYDSAVTVEAGSLEHDVDPHLMPRLPAQPRRTLRLARRLAFG